MEIKLATEMTLREHFAGLAMQGFAAHPRSYDMAGHTVATVAVTWADALLAALSEVGNA